MDTSVSSLLLLIPIRRSAGTPPVLQPFIRSDKVSTNAALNIWSIRGRRVNRVNIATLRCARDASHRSSALASWSDNSFEAGEGKLLSPSRLRGRIERKRKRRDGVWGGSGKNRRVRNAPSPSPPLVPARLSCARTFTSCQGRPLCNR